MPSWVPALTIDNASSPLLGGPTVGSLAADEEWLSAFTARIPELLADTWEGDTDGQWKVDDVNDIKVIFAGDVYRQRLVAAYVPVRTGLLRRETTVWFAGPIGADPEQMEQDSAGGEALTEPYVARVDGVDNQADVLVLAAQGSHVEASGSVEYRADGTVDRTWTPVPHTESGEYLARVPAISLEAVLLRVATPGSTAQASRFDFGTWSPSYDQELELAIEAAAAEYSAAHRELGRTWAVNAIAGLGLLPEQQDITVLWAGAIDGETAMLLAVQPKNGGVILFAGKGGLVGDGGDGATDMLRLLAPADGAYARPYAWRLEASPSGNVLSSHPKERRARRSASTTEPAFRSSSTARGRDTQQQTRSG